MTKINMIPIEKLLEMRLNEEEFTLIEVLAPRQYEKGHIPGAINIPLQALGRTAKEKFNPNDRLVVYCSSYICQASTNAAQKLVQLGFENVSDFSAGKAGWEQAGFKLES